MTRPLCIDLFCGLGGWTEGFLAEGWNVIGFDVERHVYGEHRYPAQLVLQDVLTLDGAQFKDAAIIVASPPCQEYSYMAMPWTRAKQIAKEYRDGTRDRAKLTALFDACFRIQREASAAAGHHIPLVVENVCGAQQWVGRAAWHYGSYYLWGDVPALMPMPAGRRMKSAISCAPLLFSERVASTAEEAHRLHYRLPETERGGLKTIGQAHRRDGHGHTRHLTNQAEHDAANGVKQGGDWFGDATGHALRSHSSKSAARKAASARIAKIPERLARHIAHVYYPRQQSVA